MKTSLTTEQKVKAISFFIVALVFIIWYFWPEATTTKHDSLSAYTSAQSFVKQRLKSPSTAEFNDSYSNSTEQINDSTFLINSFVDSENGFGAKVRAKFSCKIIYSSDSIIYCEDLLIER